MPSPSLGDVIANKPGALPSPDDSRNLNLGDYLKLDQMSLPDQWDWTTKKNTPWGMMRNDQLNDCTCASAGHMIECWTANGLNAIDVPDDAVLTAFCALSGYDPATGKNDNPVCYADALKYWRTTGIGGHTIRAYTEVKCHKMDLVQTTIYHFGGGYAGLALPNSIRGQEVWDVDSDDLTGDRAPASLGNHAVTLLAYDDQCLTCVSCGQKQRMTWEFWNTYGNELYAVITDDFLTNGRTPIGFDVATLQTDLLRVTKYNPFA